jgi:methylated-DNA-[protein]-cysteine S-methyltransferase
MAKKTKQSPEKLYGSTLSWEGWTFRVLSSRVGLRWIELAPTAFDQLGRRLRARVLPDDDPNGVTLREIHEYLHGARDAFSVGLDLRGTPFQRSVWEAITAIPYGGTTSYAEVAASIGRPRALRAVGQAVGANPVPIVIPCHRVIGKSGRLIGYGGGLPLKERLLALERGSLDL